MTRRPVSSMFSTMALATLALGIGLPTAVYSVFDAVLIEPLPFSEPHRIFRLELHTPDGAFGINSAVLAEVQALPGIEGTAAFVGSERTFTGGPGPQVVRGAAVTSGFFHVLGVPAARGTVFGPQSAAGDAVPIVLSHRLWQQRFASDPAVVGQTLRFDTQERVIVGVMPDRFQYPKEAEFWELLRSNAGGPFGMGPFTGFARVRSADPAEARTQAEVLSRAHASANSRQTLQLVPMLAETEFLYRPTLTMVLIGSVLVLFLACANVAHLLLATSTSRGAELSLKYALGAGPGRLVRELFVEALQFAIVAGIAGAFVSWLLLAALPAFGALDIPRLDEVRLNWRVLAFASLATAASIACFGLVPGWVMFRQGLSLLPGQKSTAGPTAQRLSRAIIAGEVAVAFVLLAGSLFVATGLYRLLTVNVGFDGQGVLVSSLRPSSAKYVGAARAALIENTLASVRAQPGIASAAVMSPLPLARELPRRINVTAQEDGGAPARVVAQVRLASDGAMATLGVPLLRGREFAPGDRGQSNVVINESLAQRLWPRAEAVGRTLQTGGPESPRLAVIGVVRDVRGSLGRLPEPEIYLNRMEQASRDITLVVRTTLSAAGAEPVVVGAVHAIDRDQPVTPPATLRSIVQTASQHTRFHAAVFGVFGGFAIALAASGILGVVAYSVVRRTREIGIRVALGARPWQLITMFVRELMPVLGIGIVLGCLGALNMTSYLAKARLLFNVAPNDPAIFAAGVVGLAVIAVAAAILPARSASRIDPVAALRAE
jgi:putative ABC transport system permease protein